MLNQTSLRSISNRLIPVRDTEVVLHFKADDVPFVIVSGISMSPFKSYCKLYKHSISKQNDLTKHSTRETRAYIEKNIFTGGFDVVLRIVHCGQHLPNIEDRFCFPNYILMKL